MARQNIFTGTTANDGTGDTLRSAFTKVNANFVELYNANTGTITFANNTISTRVNDMIFINNPTNGIQIGGSWLAQMSATSNANNVWGDGNTESYAWVFQDPTGDGGQGYAEFGTYVSGNSGANHYSEMYVTSHPENIFFIGYNDGSTYKRLSYSANGVFNLPSGGDYRIDGISITSAREIDGGNASSGYLAEITIDGGGA